MVLERKKRAIGANSRLGGRTAVELARPYWAKKTPPCNNACPNANDMRACLTTIAQTGSSVGNREEAMEKAWYTLTDTNPFPSVCGRVCPAMCMAECNRKERDEAVNIPAIERAIGDYGISNDLRHQRMTEEAHTEKVAVIGSGPSGLSCAFQLARRGYSTTIFEASAKAGGMLRYGIPSYRLPPEPLDAEIEAILNLGIDIRYNTRVGVEVSLEELQREYGAVYVAVGGQVGTGLNIDGEDMSNVLTGAAFLKRLNSGEKIDVGDRVVVIGGGDSAIDSARVACRLGADVTVHYRRTRKEMPAVGEGIVEAEEEGIRFEFLTAPTEILHDGARATGVRFSRMKLGEADASGRARPEPIAGSEFDVQADTVISAIGQQPDFAGLEQLKNEEGWISADRKGQTALSGVFAGGDVTNKLGLVVEAIALGRRAARSIDAYLRQSEAKDARPPLVVRASRIKLGYHRALPQNREPRLAAGDRANNFSVIAQPLESPQVIGEANRCMSCGLCFSCDMCFRSCPYRAIKRAPKEGLRYSFDSYCVACGICAEACPSGFIDTM
ncbi:MAG: FAD-dependent oxidoreductase [Chloroflexi bacterium]|nr:FAD-dependent oxidoreductase [Chloroflexota bacterium]